MANNYQIGDSVYTSALHELYTLSTDTWAFVDPDSGYPKITITDPSGVVKVDAVSMDKQATGKFDHTYPLVAGLTKGWWSLVIDISNGGNPDKLILGFTLGD